MSRVVTIVDYGMGNIMSISRAFEHFGAKVKLTAFPDMIEKADFLVLPGVGAFADGMAGLHKRNLVEAIKRFVKKERPFLGICLGMQMMMNSSEEFGYHEGLGLIPGKVVAIPQKGTNGKPHKIPHVGWNKLLLPSHEKGWNNTVLEGKQPGTYVYFVHSFTAIPTSDDHRLADCKYDGYLISAAIKLGPLYGCQFHPEKSGKVGLQIIKKFLRLIPYSAAKPQPTKPSTLKHRGL